MQTHESAVSAAIFIDQTDTTTQQPETAQRPSGVGDVSRIGQERSGEVRANHDAQKLGANSFPYLVCRHNSALSRWWRWRIERAFRGSFALARNAQCIHYFHKQFDGKAIQCAPFGSTSHRTHSLFSFCTKRLGLRETVQNAGSLLGRPLWLNVFRSQRCRRQWSLNQ